VDGYSEQLRQRHRRRVQAVVFVLGLLALSALDGVFNILPGPALSPWFAIR
jgi:hypothetical protein